MYTEKHLIELFNDHNENYVIMINAFRTKSEVTIIPNIRYYRVGKNFFFCLTLGQTGTGVLSYPWALCLSHHFFDRIIRYGLLAISALSF
jgi:hypothetical protein